MHEEGPWHDRLYSQAKEQRERLAEARVERLEGDVPSFTPELVARPMREDRAEERGPASEIGSRLHQARAKQLTKLQDKRIKAMEKDTEYMRDRQLEQLKVTHER